MTPSGKLSRLIRQGEAILAARYPRASKYCGGSDPVPDGIDPRAFGEWLEACANLVRECMGDSWGANLARRIEAARSLQPDADLLEELLAELKAATK